jgi:alkylhydroperoxidase family enzyme
LDLTLLHSPTIADAWHTFFAAINSRSSLTDDVRELAICRVAFVNESWYQWDGHKEALLRCNGFRQEQMESIQALKPEGQGFLTEKQWAVLRYADAMTRNVRVENRLFQELKNAGFNEGEIVDLTITIAAYNCVSRFLVALDVGEKNSAGAVKPELG